MKKNNKTNRPITGYEKHKIEDLNAILTDAAAYREYYNNEISVFKQLLNTEEKRLNDIFTELTYRAKFCEK